MINEKLLNPESIVIVGASNNISKPGGKMVKNLLDNNFQGELFSVNPKETSIQGLPTFNQVEDLPLVDLAVLAIPSKFCLHAVKVLAEQKNT
ncbi:MAG: CoA-binding protein, partial [Prolixibacteraceae bacterium]|nr:CoA-binding protein [Prolixibacteraceae bacterium]